MLIGLRWVDPDQIKFILLYRKNPSRGKWSTGIGCGDRIVIWLGLC
nr:MAG TPA: hypothetical protein [Caudoviricetes sp.]